MKLIAMLAIAAGTLSAADTLKVFGREWTVHTTSDWKVDMENGAETLRLTQGREPLPGPRRPFQFALADVPDYSRVTVEADAKPLGRSVMIVFARSEEHTSELQSLRHLVCRLLLEK